MKWLQLNDEIGSPYALLTEGHVRGLGEALAAENAAWGEEAYLLSRARFEYAIPTGAADVPWLIHRKATTPGARPVTLVYYVRPMPALEGGEE